MISFILPTHNRPERVLRTLRDLGALPPAEAEVMIVDNASATPPRAPAALDNGIPVRTIRREANEAAAARNAAARDAAGAWLVMLDDDSAPLDWGLLDALADAPPDVAAVGADIRLPDGRRESGGLPEVFVGCGAAVRRRAFVEAGGYDASFHYYAEEYDLCARLLRDGHRVVHDTRFRVGHEKTLDGRDMDTIVGRLVRNNGWVMQRYAPDADRAERLAETIERYGRIARREGAEAGYSAGLRELLDTLDRQPRRPLDRALFDRFTGRAQVRETLGGSDRLSMAGRVALVDEGKNAWVVREVLDELAVEVVADERAAETLVIGTLSPGPMLDAWERRRHGPKPVVRPWRAGHDAVVGALP